jgi:hypothetical protein
MYLSIYLFICLSYIIYSYIYINIIYIYMEYMKKKQCINPTFIIRQHQACGQQLTLLFGHGRSHLARHQEGWGAQQRLRGTLGNPWSGLFGMGEIWGN